MTTIFSQRRRLSDATVSRMKDTSCTPDTVSYSAGISACSRGKAWVKALELVEEMQEQDLKPDIIT